MGNGQSGSNAPGPKGTPHSSPGDDALQGTTGTGENLCPACNGSGKIENRLCATCDGSGVVIEGIGGG